MTISEAVESEEHRHDADSGDDTNYPRGTDAAAAEVEFEFWWFRHGAALLKNSELPFPGDD